MASKLRRQLAFLQWYTLASTIVFAGFIFMAFNRDPSPQRFQEISVERINIVERDGSLKMVISNAARQHPGIIGGKVLSKRERPAGMIFFNTDGDECGGLVYDGTKKDAGMALSVDQYNHDQIMQLQYSQEGAGLHPKYRSYGLKLWDRPDSYSAAQMMADIDSVERLKDKGKLEAFFAQLKQQGQIGSERLFVGKNKQEAVGLFIRDDKGRPRINIFVDKSGKGNIEFLDTLGKAVPFQ